MAVRLLAARIRARLVVSGAARAALTTVDFQLPPKPFPSKQLCQEHRTIEKVIKAMRPLIAPGTELQVTVLSDCVRFLRYFADGYHHKKEDEVLLRAYSKTGMPSSEVVLSGARRDHDSFKALVINLANALKSLDTPQGHASGDRRFRDTANYCLDQLQEHIRKEETELFVKGDQRLTERQQEEIQSDFDTYAKRKYGGFTVHEWELWASSLREHL